MTELQPHQQRVVDERAELDEKVKKLGAFVDGLAFAAIDPVDRALLREQLVVMRQYLYVLKQRIARFKP